MTNSTFTTGARSAATLLLLIATSAISVNEAAASRDFDPVPWELERSMDLERSEAKAWYDRDFDRDDSAGMGLGCRSDAKAWYDRDFDFSTESDDDRPGPSAAGDFDPVDPA